MRFCHGCGVCSLVDCMWLSPGVPFVVGQYEHREGASMRKLEADSSTSPQDRVAASRMSTCAITGV